MPKKPPPKKPKARMSGQQAIDMVVSQKTGSKPPQLSPEQVLDFIDTMQEFEAASQREARVREGAAHLKVHQPKAVARDHTAVTSAIVKVLEDSLKANGIL